MVNASSKSEFYQNHLDKVSRSFAFCVRELHEPLRGWVGFSYLVFRVLDTLEDVSWSSSEVQLNQIKTYLHFFSCKPSKESISSWLSQFPDHVIASEKALLQDTYTLMEDFYELPVEIQSMISLCVQSMGNGMSYFLNHQNHAQINIRSLRGVNVYCFFVAGIVGELLTYLFEKSTDGVFKAHSNQIHRSHHFGLFLQKVNLLKDQKKDKKEGRFLIPSRMLVWETLAHHSDYAFEYVEKIPKENRNYRLFCGWSLFLGLASLPWIQKDWSSSSHVKIPRGETQRILQEVRSSIDENDKLKKLYQDLKPEDSFEGHDLLHHESLPFQGEQWEKILKSYYYADIHKEYLFSLGIS